SAPDESTLTRVVGESCARERCANPANAVTTTPPNIIRRITTPRRLASIAFTSTPSMHLSEFRTESPCSRARPGPGARAMAMRGPGRRVAPIPGTKTPECTARDPACDPTRNRTETSRSPVETHWSTPRTVEGFAAPDTIALARYDPPPDSSRRASSRPLRLPSAEPPMRSFVVVFIVAGTLAAFASDARSQQPIEGVSVSADGTVFGAQDFNRPSLSPDGRWVAFSSGADLAGGDQNTQIDVFV